VINGDVVSVEGVGVGIFADVIVGVDKTVTVTGFTLDGMSSGNYNLLQPSGLTANIFANGLDKRSVDYALEAVYAADQSLNDGLSAQGYYFRFDGLAKRQYASIGIDNEGMRRSDDVMVVLKGEAISIAPVLSDY